ncbi:hypothetical protein ACPTJ3_13260 [Enterococcus faecium]
MAQALLETEPIISFAFTSRAGSISKLWTLSPFVNTHDHIRVFACRLNSGKIN